MILQGQRRKVIERMTFSIWRPMILQGCKGFAILSEIYGSIWRPMILQDCKGARRHEFVGHSIWRPIISDFWLP